MSVQGSSGLKPVYDAVVVGGGMVGASAAIGLSALGYSTLIVETFPLAAETKVYTPSYDDRSTALSWGSRQILEELGVWGTIAAQVCEICDVHVSEKGKFGTTHLSAEKLGYEALGYVVPNQVLGQSLLANVFASDVDILASATVTRVEANTIGYTLTVDQEGAQKGDVSITVSTTLLVIADGSRSKTAQLIGIDSQVESYGQHALIANVTTELSNHGVAYERFIEDGPLALLPLSDRVSSLIWTQPSDDVECYLAMNDNDFLAALQAAFGERLGRFDLCGSRASYPLSLVRVTEQYRSGLIVLGNAAHSLHPVAGQGFNLALRGVASLLDALAEAKVAKQPFANIEVLKRAVERQSLDQRHTIMLSDQLVKLFGRRSIVLGVLRDVGLVGLNSAPFIKTLFARQAMGLSGRKPVFMAKSDDVHG